MQAAGKSQRGPAPTDQREQASQLDTPAGPAGASARVTPREPANPANARPPAAAANPHSQGLAGPRGPAGAVGQRPQRPGTGMWLKPRRPAPRAVPATSKIPGRRPLAQMDPWPCFPWEWTWLGLEPVLFAVVFKFQTAPAPSPVNRPLQGQAPPRGGLYKFQGAARSHKWTPGRVFRGNGRGWGWSRCYLPWCSSVRPPRPPVR